MADLLHPPEDMDPLEYVQKRHRRLGDFFDRVTGADREEDRQIALSELIADLDDFTSVLRAKVFPVLEQHELLRGRVLELHQKQAQITALCNLMRQSRWGETLFTDSFDRVYHLMIDEVRLLGSDLLPMSQKILGRDELQKLSTALDQDSALSRPAA